MPVTNKHIRKINGFFVGGLKVKSVLVFILYLAAISTLEMLAYKKAGIFSCIAARVWLVSAALLGALFVVYAMYKLISDIKDKSYLIILGFLAIFGFFCSLLGNISFSDINPDAAQQLAAGLTAFEMEDFNYTGTAFLGYSARQYLLAALPALLFGRNEFTLHLGFAYPFLIGLTLMYTEFRAWLKSKEINESYALLPIYAFSAFRFVSEYYMNFEQALTPLALTMIGMALFLRFYRRHDLLTAFALAWVGCFACDAYTPVLASLGLLICFLLLYVLGIFVKKQPVFESKKEKWCAVSAALAMVINIICFFTATLLVERADRITLFRENVNLFKLAYESWFEFFTEKNATFFGFFLGLVLIYMVLSLLGRLKIQNFTIACWTLGVVFFSNYLVGYTQYTKCWIMQRNMIIIPLLVCGIFMSTAEFIKKHNYTVHRKCWVVFLLALALLNGSNLFKAHQSFTYFNYVTPIKFAVKCTESELKKAGLSNTDEFNLVILTDNKFQTNIGDYALFFFPNAHTVACPTNREPRKPDESLFTIYLSEEGNLSELLNEPAEVKSYMNLRNRKEITWYLIKR